MSNMDKEYYIDINNWRKILDEYLSAIKDADNLNEAADIIENAILYMDMVNSSISSVMDDYEDKMLKVLEKY